ncbi:MAG: 5'-nucleotidase C-terminal domain-containing protein, partial [Vampirovibrio sp.]|nr:5'-nucleotidase C-terminal domain-containing protein [Vampirovibrio sp.]
LTFHAGDMAIGKRTSRVTLAKLLKIWRDAGLTAMTAGSHDFEPPHFFNMLRQRQLAAKKNAGKSFFPVLGVNLKLPSLSNPDWFGLFEREPLITETDQGDKYGVIGIVDPQLPKRLMPIENPYSIDSRTLSETIETIKKQVNSLEEKGINKIILLSHAGYQNDLQLAKIPGVDIIVGGSSHTNLPKGMWRTTDAGEPVLITQAGREGRFFGKINAVFDAKGVLDRRQTKTTTQRPNELSAAERAVFKEQYRDTVATEVAKISLGHDNHLYKFRPGWLPNMTADAMLDLKRLSAKSTTFPPYNGPDIDIALFRSSNLRTSFGPGRVTTNTLEELFPLNTRLRIVEVSGRQIRRILNYSARTWEAKPDPGMSLSDPVTMFPAGLFYMIDPVRSQVSNVMVKNKITSRWEPLQDENRYVVALDRFNFIAEDLVNEKGQYKRLWGSPNLKMIWRAPAGQNLPWLLALKLKEMVAASPDGWVNPSDYARAASHHVKIQELTQAN